MSIQESALLRKVFCCLTAILLMNACVAIADDSPSEYHFFKGTEKKDKEDDEHSTLHVIACYLPNRILDALDIFRARVRLGPGLGVGVRATKYVSAYAGSYATVFAGLPGPRDASTPRLPVGLESLNGASVSAADATINGGIGPNYSSTEFGVGAQLGIIGADIGFDPLEIVDFALGIFTIDLEKDDF